MDYEDKELLLKNATDIEEVEALLDPQEAQVKQSRRRTSIILAILLWLGTFVLAARSAMPIEVVNNQSASGELLFVSFLGLLLVIFSDDTLASYTGFPIFYSWIPINRPTPLILLRAVGWVLLIGIALTFAIY